MTDGFDENAERAWAAPQFRSYLLGALNQDDSERVSTAVALLPGFVDELEEAERQLIDDYLEAKLDAVERRQFETQYVHSEDEENRAKFHLQQVLRLPQTKQERSEPARMVSRGFNPWPMLAVAASIGALILGGLYIRETRKLETALATLNSKEVPSRGPVEQPAGPTTGEALTLPGQNTGTTVVRVVNAPHSLVWAPVPDYRVSYRMRIAPAGSRPITSGLLDPKNNAVSFDVQNADSLTLPWHVFILPAEGDKPIAHFVLLKQ